MLFTQVLWRLSHVPTSGLPSMARDGYLTLMYTHTPGPWITFFSGGWFCLLDLMFCTIIFCWQIWWSKKSHICFTMEQKMCVYYLHAFCKIYKCKWGFAWSEKKKMDRISQAQKCCCEYRFADHDLCNCQHHPVDFILAVFGMGRGQSERSDI